MGGAAMRCQEEPARLQVHNWRGQENHEEPGGARRTRKSQLEGPGGAMMGQEEPGGARWSQEEPGGLDDHKWRS